jgi:RNA recognition motif-containing protein
LFLIKRKGVNVMNIHVSNLSPDTTEEDLKKIFSKFGKVKSVGIIRYPADKSEGYGFIDKPASAEAKDSLQNVNEEKNNTIPMCEIHSRN